jgi:hypothetical protein
MRIKRLPDGQLRYCYAAGDDLAFEFSIECEVGEPHRAMARARLQDLRDRGYTISFSEPLHTWPWVSDFARKPKEH